MNVEANSKKSGTRFFTPGARLAFAKLTQAFNIALIFYHFHLIYEIWIETNVSGYVIGGILSEQTLHNLG